MLLFLLVLTVGVAAALLRSFAPGVWQTLVLWCTGLVRAATRAAGGDGTGGCPAWLQGAWARFASGVRAALARVLPADVLVRWLPAAPARPRGATGTEGGGEGVPLLADGDGDHTGGTAPELPPVRRQVSADSPPPSTPPARSRTPSPPAAAAAAAVPLASPVAVLAATASTALAAALQGASSALAAAAAAGAGEVHGSPPPTPVSRPRPRNVPRVALSGLPPDVQPLLSEAHRAFLCAALPRRCRVPAWRLAFHTHVHGYNLATLYAQAARVKDSLLVVCTAEGATAAAFATRPWAVQRHFYGGGESAVFALHPTPAAHGWSQANKLFQLAQPDALAVGGGGDGFAMCVDGALQAGSSAACATFGNPGSLLGAAAFQVAAVELWQVGGV